LLPVIQAFSTRGVNRYGELHPPQALIRVADCRKVIRRLASLSGSFDRAFFEDRSSVWYRNEAKNAAIPG